MNTQSVDGDLQLLHNRPFDEIQNQGTSVFG